MVVNMKKIIITAINASYTHTSLAVRSLAKNCDAQIGTAIETVEFTINDRAEKAAAALFLRRDMSVGGTNTYAFSCYIWNIDFVLDVAARLKAVLPDCAILLGGPEVSYDACNIMHKNTFVDYIICGEGERSLAAFARGENAEGIAGLVYRSAAKGGIVQNPPLIIADLDTLAPLYTAADIAALAGRMLYYETSRGCPYNCSYCLSSTLHGVRFFSLERVFSDLALFIENGARLVKFVDRTFNCDDTRMQAILRFILAKGGDTCFHFEVAAHSLSGEVMALLASAPKGMFQLEIGVQSTNAETLCAINRITDTVRLADNVRTLRKANNIHLHLDLIAGLPYEDYASFGQSFNDVYALEPHAVQIGFLKLLKGSPIRKKMDEYGYITVDTPPYEVLGSKWLGYGELLRLKDIAELVDRFHNSGVFERSLTYVVHKYTNGGMLHTPFGFYERFAAFWRRSGYSTAQHARVRLYDIFCEFCTAELLLADALFLDLLKLDFLLNNRGVRLPVWACGECGDGGHMPEKTLRGKVFELLNGEARHRYLPHLDGYDTGELYKRIRAEIFNYDVCGGGAIGQNVVLIDADAKFCIKISEKI